jgi:hypothetical protein
MLRQGVGVCCLNVNGAAVFVALVNPELGVGLQGLDTADRAGAQRLQGRIARGALR